MTILHHLRLVRFHKERTFFAQLSGFLRRARGCAGQADMR